MNLEFAGRFNKPELLLKEFNHWVIILRESVVTLGSCVIILKSGKPSLKDVSNEEMSELPQVCKWFEEKTKELYGAVKWNYLAMMMKDEFVHFHAIPRYENEVEIYNKKWVDEDYPSGTKMNKIDVEHDVLMEIKEDMAE
jgi:diadenosine tetraphosphate (Ap4A) HIT family hydrolase